MPFYIKYLAIVGVVLGIITGIYSYGYKAGADNEKAKQLEILKQMQHEYQAKLQAAQSKAETLIKSVEQQKQQVKIKWRTKYEVIYRDRKRDDVLCYDAIRMQRQKDRVDAANKSTEALFIDAATSTNQPTD